MSSFVNLLDIVYPVGAVVHTFSSTSPASTVGGTWVAVETFLLGSDSAGVEGGEEEHTLSIKEMPSHSHNLGGCLDNTTRSIGNSGNNWVQNTDTKTEWAVDYFIKTTGESAAHNNMPPYTTCFIWRRTA